jgi:protein TonB
MVEGKQYNKLTRTWALGISLLLHGMVLAVLHTAGSSNPGPVPEVMITYLAIPSAVPDGVFDSQSTLQKKAASEPAKTRPAPPPPKPQKVMRRSAPGITSPVEVSRPEPEPVSEIKLTDLEKAEPEMVDEVFDESSTRQIQKDLETVKNIGAEFAARNPKPETQNPSNALLAFAGDPASLGMMAMGALGNGLVKAEALSLPEPVYPVLSRKRGEEGRVIIELEISAEGKVLKAEVANSSSYPRLDRAALEAVKKAAFSPATEYGRPVESELKVAYRFKLEN